MVKGIHFPSAPESDSLHFEYESPVQFMIAAAITSVRAA